MNKIIIPIDFSAATQQVLDYAAALSHDITIDRIILLKSGDPSIYEQILPVPEYPQIDNEEDEAEHWQEIRRHAEELTGAFTKKVNPATKVSLGVTDESLLRAVIELIATEQPDMLFVTSDQSESVNSPIASQVIALVKASPVPVFVIPAHLSYQPLSKALVPVDFNAIARVSVLKRLLTFHDQVRPELVILNVSADQKQLSDYPAIEQTLSGLLEKYYYSIHLSNDQNVLRGILDTAAKDDARLIVALPGKYSFFSNLTHVSITQALAKQARVPVLVLK